MKEDFLHYVWKNQYFNKENLIAFSGENVSVIKTGLHNHDAGPDFSQAHIYVDKIGWFGSVEIHIKSSDWYAHKHQTDAAYGNVILHVVWEYDQAISRPDGTTIPTIELKSRIDFDLFKKYENLVDTKQDLPCSAVLGNVESVVKSNMLDRVLMERLQNKTNDIIDILRSNQNDWEETAYQVLAKNFGFRINAWPFQELSKRLPLKILMRHKSNPTQFKALLLGQASFLEKDSKTENIELLRREFSFLKYKYNLQPLAPHLWKFLRLRPANFPTVRLTQFMNLMLNHDHLFRSMLEIETLEGIYTFFNPVKYSNRLLIAHPEKINAVPSNEFQKVSPQKLDSGIFPGKESIHNLLINSVVPLLVAWSRYNGQQDVTDRAITLLENIPAEKNKITRRWVDDSFPLQTAVDSQAMNELVGRYCNFKRCLECMIGDQVLSKVG